MIPTLQSYKFNNDDELNFALSVLTEIDSSLFEIVSVINLELIVSFQDVETVMLPFVRQIEHLFLADES